jgi:hypothetical protein
MAQHTGFILRPIMKAYMYYITIMYFYKQDRKSDLRRIYSVGLNKIAPPTLVNEAITFYKIISKTKNWYLKESDDFRVVPSIRRLDAFLDNLCKELGINLRS